MKAFLSIIRQGLDSLFSIGIRPPLLICVRITAHLAVSPEQSLDPYLCMVSGVPQGSVLGP